MPWEEVSTMSLRKEFALLALQDGANRRELCRCFGISPKTGYKWLKRYMDEGDAGLVDRSRRPNHSPNSTPLAMERAVVKLRKTHPAWGGRKLHRRLSQMGVRPLPSPSTITAILHRHSLIEPEASQKAQSFVRFERAAPNQLWQMDFKGHFAMKAGRCHPLTVLDDHSRFNLTLHACPDEQGLTVQAALTKTFRRYGLPERMLMDNGAPWGNNTDYPLTPLTVWLIRLGVNISHSRPYHPQTMGKDERFHRTLKAEVLSQYHFTDLAACQRRFNRWRDTYNQERPHESLKMDVPVQHYQPSQRHFSDTLPEIEYGPADKVRKVQNNGHLFFKGHIFRISKALHGYPVALRPLPKEGEFSVHFCHMKVAEIDLRKPYR
ncbi:MAG: IS481 family transposase [Candidatus Thiodiazotropha taylori]|nr:IS481 family transposase [Candidatus Thiodiazotropha taylori]